MSTFDGRKALWMWEYSQQAEKDVASACATTSDLAGASLLLVKVMDGSDWMSLYDPGGYGSLDQLQADAQAAAARGVTLVPWVVPHGQDPESEAAFHAELGSLLVVDVEPYPGFWTGPASNLPAYLQALRNHGVMELHISIDPRGPALTALGGLRSFAQLVDGIHPQAYWTDFGQAALSVVPMIQAVGGAAPVYPVLPGDGTAADLAAVWSQAEAGGCSGVSLWRLGSADADRLAAFKGLQVQSQPDPTPSGLSLEQRVGELENTVQTLTVALSRMNDVLVKRFQGVITALDPQNPPA
jgi:hypothetical protein